METIEKAQKELDERMETFYEQNADGGSPDDVYRIRLKVAMKYGIDETELN